MNLLNKKKNKGFALLFAVLISSIILSISLGVANIALKEINFSSSIRDGNDAFFAADVGAECAFANDKLSSDPFGVSGVGPVYCEGQSLTLNGSYPFRSFVVHGRQPLFGGGPGLGGLGNACALVTVLKTTDNNVVPPVPITVVTSNGYSSGSYDCTATGANRLERVIQAIR